MYESVSGASMDEGVDRISMDGVAGQGIMNVDGSASRTMVDMYGDVSGASMDGVQVEQ